MSSEATVTEEHHVDIVQSEFVAFIGIDWADRKHDLCLQVAGTGARERSILEHSPRALHAWADELRKRFNGAKIAVCLELTKGPIVSALLEHEFFVICPVQPSLLAKYRRAFTPSHAKDDPTDAELALDLLLRYPERIQRLKPESPRMRMLRQLVETRRGLVEDRVRVTNRITANLKAYFPQVLELFREKDTGVFADFLERWPTIEAAKKARRTALETFFRDHNVRNQATIDRRIAAVKDGQALTTDEAVIGPAKLLVELSLLQLKALCTAVARLDDEIDHCCAKLADYKLFAALPGAGPALAPRLLAAFGEQRARFPNAASFQKYVGVAPVTERSGNKCWVHWRYSCSTFLRQTFVEWVAQTITRSFWAKAYYESYRARGGSHQAALRALAFKWIRILHRCWADRQPYDESKYLIALQKRQAPLLKHVTATVH
jgi:transposase